MSTPAEELLLDQLQRMDKKIAEEERALTHLNKQVGNKISKLNGLNEERRKISEAYRNLQKQPQPEQVVHGLTMREVK